MTACDATNEPERRIDEASAEIKHRSPPCQVGLRRKIMTAATYSMNVSGRCLDLAFVPLFANIASRYESTGSRSVHQSWSTAD